MTDNLIMANLPQLSAELEKKTIKMSVTSGAFQFEWDLEVYEGKCIQFIKIRNGQLGYREFELKDELATALEEQKQEILSEVEEMINTKYPLNRFADSYTGIMSRGKQMPTSVVPLSPDDEEAVSFLEFILNQLKGEK